MIADKINLGARTITRDKKGHFIMPKRIIHQEDITILTLYAPNDIDPNT